MREGEKSGKGKPCEGEKASLRMDGEREIEDEDGRWRVYVGEGYE